MTILFYKVGDFFTTKFDEAKVHEAESKCECIPLYAEYPHIDDLVELSKITLEDLKNKYYTNDVKFY